MVDLEPGRVAAALWGGDELHTLRELGRLVGVPKRTVESWVRRGLLPVITVDGVKHALLTDTARLERDLRHSGTRRHTPRVWRK